MSKKTIAGLLQDDKSNWFQDNVVENSPFIIAVFANLVVIFADYRVYDVMYQLTGSWWKSLAASLGCAIPFLLWELGWQYNHTTDGWRTASLVMAGMAFITSLVLGVADYVGFTSAYADLLLGGVVLATGVHTVVGLLYYYNDPDVARRRHKSQAMATMLDQEQNALVAESLLQSGKSLLGVIEALNKDYDPEDVEQVLNILQGKKKSKPSERPTMRPAYASTSTSVQKVNSTPKSTGNNAPKWYSLADFLSEAQMTQKDVLAFGDYQKFAQFASQKMDVSGKNMKQIWRECGGQFQNGGSPNSAGGGNK